MAYLLYILAILGAVVAGALLVASIKTARLRRQASGALSAVFASTAEVPRLEFGSSFDYPTFKVVFRNHPQLQAATEAGLNATFRNAIAQIYKDAGPRGRPAFDAELAVSFVHENILRRGDISVE